MPPKKQQQKSLIRVSTHGGLGYKMMTPRQFERMQEEQYRAEVRKKRNKKYAGQPKDKGKKKKRWIIPGILYY